MRRKEQEARIEQQRQEKEKAREDAARERARYVDPNSIKMQYVYTGGCSNSPLIPPDTLMKGDSCFTVVSHCFCMSCLKRPRGASRCSQCCSAGGHGGAAEEDSDEGKFIPCHLASPWDTIQEFPVSHVTPGFWFFHSMMRAAEGIWSKSSRGKRRLLSSAVVDMLTQTTPPN